MTVKLLFRKDIFEDEKLNDKNLINTDLVY